MKRRIVSILMALTMALSLLPAQVLAQELTQLGQNSAYTTGEDAVPLTYGNGQDTALLRSIALQNIGPNEAEVMNDLYEKMTNQVSLIKLIADIDVGTLTIDYPVTIDLNGHVLRAPYGGSVIKISSGGHLTITDSNPKAEHKFKDDGTGLWVLDTNGDKTVYGGVITGGTGVTIADGNTNGISDNSICGGGVLIESGGKLTMNGGSIVGCKANNDGGGVSASAPFVMNGGTIQNCTTKASLPLAERMGGVFLVYGPHILNGTIDAGNAMDGKYIFVNNCDVTIGENANIQANIAFNGGTVEMNANATFKGAVTGNGSMYTPVATANEFTTALKNTGDGIIRLMNDITIDTRVSLGAIQNDRQVTLDLNGHVLDLKKDAIRVAGGNQKGSMTIMDSDPNVPHKFTPNDEGLWVWDKGAGTGTETVLGGVITCSDSSSSSAISAGGGSTVTMNGGSIVGCTAKDGGDAICLRGGRMNANGGTVDGTVEIDADSVITGGGSTFTGLIINNSPQAQFSGAHSPLGIVGEKPGPGSSTYCTVTFDPADSTMERTTRYFLQGKNISSEIRPAPPHGLHLRRLVQG